MSIPESAFVSLDQFALRWRFAGPSHGKWPPERLGRLRPLSAEAAAALLPRVTEACREGGATGVMFRSDDAPGDVRRRLEELPPASHETIIVSWDVRVAAVTDWETFVAHWDDFCYSAADDVTVLPLDGNWALWYYHYDVFRFGISPAAQ